MKRIFLFVLTLTLLLTITSCDGSKGDTDDKQVKDKTNQEEETDNNQNVNTNDDEDKNIDNDKNQDITIEEQVIFEGNDIKVTATGLTNDDFFGPSVTVLIENNSSNNITVQSRYSSVNGVMIDSLLSADVVAGKKTNDTISFSADSLEIAGIPTIKDIELSLHIIDAESWDTLIDTDIITINTSADSSIVQEYDNSGHLAYDSDGIKIVIKNLNSSSSLWGSDVHVYIENNTDENITVQARDVSLNGFMVDPIFSCDVLSGKRAFDTITFMESDLTDNNISDITDLELKFHIINLESWDLIKDTDVIEVSFE
ncbi:MAG: hypothetical protein GX237_00210 [Clostridiales bacterium]|nr:hypothetical protein [Clostridiales bacterium]